MSLTQDFNKAVVVLFLGVVIVRIWLLLGKNSLERNSLVWQRSRLQRWTVLRNGIFAASTRWVHAEVSGTLSIGSTPTWSCHLVWWPQPGQSTGPSSSLRSAPCVLLRLLLHFRFEKQKRCSARGRAFFSHWLHTSQGRLEALLSA